jgi:crotonobetainyl-CoA:carnitine CoA-transferase CaiB-like acyl-CoA transferase
VSADASGGSARLPLAGVRVVDFTQFVAGSHTTLWLASLGAEVIRIESPSRPDPFRSSLLKLDVEPTLNNSPIFVVTNLMKRSCAIELTEPEGQRLCHELVKRSDVVVANFRPGILEQFNMGYAALRKINPSIVMAAITGYGYHGAYAAFQAMAPPMHAFSGLCAATGYPDGPPEQTYSTYADCVVGLMAVPSILAALRHRELTGEGRFIDVAMSEAMIAVAPELVLRAALFGEQLPRRGNNEEGFAPHGCYPCAGRDRWISIATFDDGQWLELTQVLGLAEASSDPRFASLAGRWESRAEIDKLVGEATRSWDPIELAARLQEAGVAAAPVRTSDDVLTDEQLREDGFIQSVVHAELGEAYLPALPWRIETDGVSSRPMGPAPDFGEGTRGILGDVLGLTDAEWDDLRERGIVA